MIVASPLTRATQTAMLALNGHPTIERDGLLLMANCREFKSHVSSLDCNGVAIGKSEIRKRCLDELASSLRKSSSSFSSVEDNPKEDQDDEEELICGIPKERLYDIQMTCGDCENGRWWTSVKHSEDDEDITKRLAEFMLFLRYRPETSIVVVSHSNFFRHLMRNYVSRTLQDRRPDWIKTLQTHKLENCAVAELTMEFSRARFGSGGGPNAAITDVRMVFGTKLVSGDDGE